MALVVEADESNLRTEIGCYQRAHTCVVACIACCIPFSSANETSSGINIKGRLAAVAAVHCR